MIYYVDKVGLNADYYRTWGIELSAQVKRIRYRHLIENATVPFGSYIFSDIERLDSSEATRAAKVRAALDNCDDSSTHLNDPARTMCRYELLRTLYKQGINRFNIYRLTECCRPENFPVFIRVENDHLGSLTDLLHDEQQLDSAIAALAEQRLIRNDKVIIEYCDTSDDNGIFRKYGAFVIGEEIIADHILFSRKWQNKSETSLGITSDDMLAEETRFVEENPHEQALRKIARLAHIQYGRIDYSVLDGDLQIWEINTNPTLPNYVAYRKPSRRHLKELSTQRINRALAALNPPRGRRVWTGLGQTAGRFDRDLAGHLPYRLQPAAIQLLRGARSIAKKIPVVKRLGKGGR